MPGGLPPLRIRAITRLARKAHLWLVAATGLGVVGAYTVLTGGGREWAIYVFAGVVIVVVFVADALASRVRGDGRALAVDAQSVGGVIGLILLGAITVAFRDASLVVIGAAEVGIGALWLLHRRRTNASEPAGVVGLAVVVAMAAWAIALKLAWFANFSSWETASLARLVFSVAVACAMLATFRFSPLADSVAAGRLIDVAAVLLLAAVSFRVDPLFTYSGYAHWSFWVGPALQVRHGGWLLWDVPSQYGYGSILALAAMPLRSIWQSLYVLNGVLNLGSALVVYWPSGGAAAGGSGRPLPSCSRVPPCSTGPASSPTSRDPRTTRRREECATSGVTSCLACSLPMR